MQPLVLRVMLTVLLERILSRFWDIWHWIGVVGGALWDQKAKLDLDQALHTSKRAYQGLQKLLKTRNWDVSFVQLSSSRKISEMKDKSGLAKVDLRLSPISRTRQNWKQSLEKDFLPININYIIMHLLQCSVNYSI